MIASVNSSVLEVPPSQAFTPTPNLILKLEPRIKARIERIVLMGGAFTMLMPEYNIMRDRIAADNALDAELWAHAQDLWARR